MVRLFKNTTKRTSFEIIIEMFTLTPKRVAIIYYAFRCHSTKCRKPIKNAAWDFNNLFTVKVFIIEKKKML